jgi:signal transduction histidine kinase
MINLFNKKDYSVAKEMAILSISIGLIFSIISTFINTYLEYKSEEHKLDKQVKTIISSNTNAIGHALWEFHDDFIQSLMLGILAHPQISKVQVIAKTDGKKHQISQKKPNLYREKIIDLQHENRSVGELLLQINLDPMQKLIYGRALNLFITNLIEALLLTFLILLFLRLRVARPLGILSKKAYKIVEVYSTQPNQQISLSKNKNEIKFLDKIIHIMQDAIKDHIADLRKADGKLKSLNKELEKKVATRTKELNNKNDVLKSSLEKIQSAKKQLVAQEKMASLGSITSGVAHEINNPLNFIINAALINNKLIAELKEDEKFIKNINEETERKECFESLVKFNTMIKDHGKRIDHIVKSMLTLSKKGSPTLNKVNLPYMIKEIILITYKSHKKVHLFDVNLVFNMPEEIIFHCYQHELTRVLVAIFENSYYALRQRLDQSTLDQASFEVTIIDRQNDLDLILYDNGSGMKKDEIDQAFTPFFSTKPTGVGTGLGLSTVFDIITEVHKGRITIDSIENEFTRVIITLPKSHEDITKVPKKE